MTLRGRMTPTTVTYVSRAPELSSHTSDPDIARRDAPERRVGRGCWNSRWPNTCTSRGTGRGRPRDGSRGGGCHRTEIAPVTGHQILKRSSSSRRKKLTPQSSWPAVFRFLARWPSRRGTNLALVGHSLIVELEDYDIRVPVLGMGGEVAIARCIPVLVIATSDVHDLQRTVLLAPLLNQVNRAGKSADERRRDHCGCPYLATARPVAVERRSGSPPQGRHGFPSAHR